MLLLMILNVYSSVFVVNWTVPSRIFQAEVYMVLLIKSTITSIEYRTSEVAIDSCPEGSL